MSEYIVLVFDYGHINASHVIAASDDTDAIQQAKKFLDGNDIEVWQQSRFVKRLKPDWSERD
jgi:hypothetical protein